MFCGSINFLSLKFERKIQMKTDLISPGYGSAFSSEPARKTLLFFIDFKQSTSNSKNDSLFTKNSIWHVVEFNFVWIIWIFLVNQKYEAKFSKVTSMLVMAVGDEILAINIHYLLTLAPGTTLKNVTSIKIMSPISKNCHQLQVINNIMSPTSLSPTSLSPTSLSPTSLHNLIAFLSPSINIKCNSWKKSLWFHSSNEHF